MRELRQGEVKLLAPGHTARRGSQDVCPERGLHHSEDLRERRTAPERQKERDREGGRDRERMLPPALLPPPPRESGFQHAEG